MHERVYIHILVLVGMAIKRTFDATVRRVCVEVFGDTFTGFIQTEVKSYPRMVAKLRSCSDDARRPRPPLNMDVVRCLVSVPLTGDIEPFLACLARATDGFMGFTNNYQCTPEELCKLFHLRLVLVTIRLNAGRTFGEMCRDPTVQGHVCFFSGCVGRQQDRCRPTPSHGCCCWKVCPHLCTQAARWTTVQMDSVTRAPIQPHCK